MKCDILECCHFITENLVDFPQTADYIHSNLCRGDFKKCNRYRLYQGFGTEDIPFDLDLADSENMEKIKQCLKLKAELEKKG